MAKIISTNAVMMKLFGKTGLSESKKIINKTNEKFNIDVYAEAYATILADKYRMRAENYALRYYTKTKLAKGESLANIKSKVKDASKNAIATIKYLIKKIIVFIKQLIIKMTDKTRLLKKLYDKIVKLIIQLRGIKSQGKSKFTINRNKYLIFSNPLFNLIERSSDSKFLGELNEKSALKNPFEIIVQLEKYFAKYGFNTEGFVKEFETEIKNITNTREKAAEPEEIFKLVSKNMKTIRTKKLDDDTMNKINGFLKNINRQVQLYKTLFTAFEISLNYSREKMDNEKNETVIQVETLISSLESLNLIAKATGSLVKEIAFIKKALDQIDLALSTQKQGINSEQVQKTVDEMREKIVTITSNFGNINKTSSLIINYIKSIVKEVSGLPFVRKEKEEKQPEAKQPETKQPEAK